MKANYLQATANVTGLTAQVAFNAKRLADIELLAAEDANTQFRAQDRKNSYETMLVSISSYTPRISKGCRSAWIKTGSLACER